MKLATPATKLFFFLLLLGVFYIIIRNNEPLTPEQMETQNIAVEQPDDKSENVPIIQTTTTAPTGESIEEILAKERLVEYNVVSTTMPDHSLANKTLLGADDESAQQQSRPAGELSNSTPTEDGNATDTSILKDDIKLILPTPSSTKGPITALEALKYRALLSETTFEATPNITTRAQAALAYELYFARKCLRAMLENLRFNGMSEATNFEECSELLETLLRLDPLNPTAICARDGLSSKSCETNSLAGNFRQWSAEQIPAPTAKDQQTMILIRKRITELQNKLSSDEKAQEAEIMNELRSLYTTALRIECFRDSLIFEEDGRLIKGRSPFDDPFDKLEDPARVPEIFRKQEETKDKTLPKLGNYKRIRLLRSTCLRLTDEALKFDPLFAIPICYRYGFYTNRCIKAKIDETQRRTTTPTSMVKDSEIGRF